MNRLLRKTKEAFLTKQTGIISTTIIISSMLILARVFGFLRFRLLNSFYTTAELDIFIAAFRIPDFIFEVIITGALTSTFIPFYLSYKNDHKKQSEISSSILNTLLILLAIFTIIVLLFTVPIMGYLTGFEGDKLQSVASQARVLLVLQLPFMVVGNFFTGLSQSNRLFLIPSIAPILYNLGIVVVVLVFHTQLGIMAPVYGVVAGAIMFFFVHFAIFAKIDFKYHLRLSHMQEVYSFFKKIVPRIITVVVAQIETTFDLRLASTLASGSYTVFYYAQHLQLLPVSLLGIAFGQASLPYLTEMYQSKKYAEFRVTVIQSIGNIFFVTVPVAMFFVMARTPITRLVYGGYKFDWVSTVETAITLSYFAISIPFHSAYYFLIRAFYSMNDQKTPFVVTIVSIIINTALSIYAIYVAKFGVYALGATFSITIIIQVIWLFILLARKIDLPNITSLLKELVKIGVSATLAVTVMYPMLRIFDGLIFDTTRTINLVLLLATITCVGFLSYIFAVWTLDAQSLHLIAQAVTHIKGLKNKFNELIFGVETK